MLELWGMQSTLLLPLLPGPLCPEVSYKRHSLEWRFLFLCRNEIDILNSPFQRNIRMMIYLCMNKYWWFFIFLSFFFRFILRYKKNPQKNKQVNKQTHLVERGCSIHRFHLCKGMRTSTPASVLCMTLNCIWWWHFTPGTLGNVD